MQSFLEKLFGENSSISSMRVMSLLLIVVAMIIALSMSIYGMATGKAIPDALSLVGILIGSALTGKVTQKFAENKEVTK